MLVVTRSVRDHRDQFNREDEIVVVTPSGERITFYTLASCSRGEKVRIGIDAPKEFHILRGELDEADEAMEVCAQREAP